MRSHKAGSKSHRGEAVIYSRASLRRQSVGPPDKDSAGQRAAGMAGLGQAGHSPGRLTVAAYLRGNLELLRRPPATLTKPAGFRRATPAFIRSRRLHASAIKVVG
jgi:hypothetical protein